MNKRPYILGLTGNIATGKSMVASILSRLGADHIDADRLTHQVMARGTPAWERIVARFGLRVLKPNGTIDRTKLGAIVFADPKALADLEAMIHPDVIAYTQRLIASSTAPAVVVEAIKLIESGMVQRLCNAVWVITAPREVQIQRLMEHRSLSYEDAVLRVDGQSAQEIKIACADVVIDNGGALESTVHQVERAWADTVKIDHVQPFAVQ